MKTTLLCFLLILTSNVVFGQMAYIQVTGEPGLSVFLNGQFKGKTSAEYNGLIIENVTAGKNIIKVVKEGYTPFEETITIKPGEVFAYKVKPFTKHIVEISQEGNTGETDKKAVIETGELIVQSVPIEISITMPDIEGVNKSPKIKDKWQADKIPTGSYEITFAYGEKVITKTVEIESGQITGVFVNMLNGDFVVTTKEKPPYNNRDEAISYINQLLSKQGAVTYGCYKGTRGLEYKIVERTYSYDHYALKYSAELKSYSISYTGQYLSWGLSNEVPYEIKGPNNYTSKSPLKGQISFEEESCDVKTLVTGSCSRFWVFTDDDLATPGRNVMAIYLTGKDPKIIEQLKKAFIYLNELSMD